MLMVKRIQERSADIAAYYLYLALLEDNDLLFIMQDDRSDAKPEASSAAGEI
jgi:hypothetical protein